MPFNVLNIKFVHIRSKYYICIVCHIAGCLFCLRTGNQAAMDLFLHTKSLKQKYQHSLPLTNKHSNNPKECLNISLVQNLTKTNKNQYQTKTNVNSTLYLKQYLQTSLSCKIFKYLTMPGSNPDSQSTTIFMTELVWA